MSISDKSKLRWRTTDNSKKKKKIESKQKKIQLSWSFTFIEQLSKRDSRRYISKYEFKHVKDTKIYDFHLSTKNIKLLFKNVRFIHEET